MKINVLNIRKHTSSWNGAGFGLYVNSKLIAAFSPETAIEKNINRIFENPLREIKFELVVDHTSISGLKVYNIFLNNVFVGKCEEESLVYKNIVSLKN